MICANTYFRKHFETAQAHAQAHAERVAALAHRYFIDYWATLAEGDVTEAITELGADNPIFVILTDALRKHDTAEAGRLLLRVVGSHLKDAARRRAEIELGEV